MRRRAFGVAAAGAPSRLTLVVVGGGILLLVALLHFYASRDPYTLIDVSFANISDDDASRRLIEFECSPARERCYEVRDWQRVTEFDRLAILCTIFNLHFLLLQHLRRPD